MNFVNVAPNGNDADEIADNLVYTEVNTNGLYTGADVNVVPNTWLTSGVTSTLTSGMLNSVKMLSISNLAAGTYQTNFSATYTGTSFGANDVIDFYWSGTTTTNPAGSTDSLLVCSNDYSTVRSLGTFNSTDTFVLPVAETALNLYARFNGTGTSVSCTIFPYVSLYKIA